MKKMLSGFKAMLGMITTGNAYADSTAINWITRH